LTLEAIGQVTIKATQPGDATYASAEPVEQSFEIVLVTGIPEQRGPQFKFYPNPISNTLTVIPNGSNNQLSLRNAHGQTVSAMQSTSRDAIQLDVSSLPLGIYILQVANESGISQTKILKK
ncbi:MAG: T9SS type A sorting domain-containing protein, partial [Cyclobacteriaceae bacterium]